MSEQSGTQSIHAPEGQPAAEESGEESGEEDTVMVGAIPLRTSGCGEIVIDEGPGLIQNVLIEYGSTTKTVTRLQLQDSLLRRDELTSEEKVEVDAFILCNEKYPGKDAATRQARADDLALLNHLLILKHKRAVGDVPSEPVTGAGRVRKKRRTKKSSKKRRSKKRRSKKR